MEFRSSESPRYLNEQQVAAITGISRSSLQQNRWKGKGIAYSKIGRSIRYLQQDVLEFMARQRIEVDDDLFSAADNSPMVCPNCDEESCRMTCPHCKATIWTDGHLQHLEDN
jgi:predicted DNA-binding transcriptional regulator AlpA